MKELNRINILILDPDRDTGELFARALQFRKNSKCYFAASSDEAVDLITEIPFELILVDMSLAMSGQFDFIKKIRRISPASKIVIDAWLHQKAHVENALALGIHGYIIKPIKVELFRKRIEEFCCVNPDPGL
jgi:response regulator of citrate/malate metabolism